MYMRSMALDLSRFRPHVLLPNMDILLYHVYDDLSQTPFVPNEGIFSGDPHNYVLNLWHIITTQKMMEHLEWNNRNPTWMISFYDDRQLALSEQLRRRNHTHFFDVATGERRIRNPNRVRIAVVSARRLQDRGCLYFSTADIRWMLRTGPNHPLFTMYNQCEWFVLDWVPVAAVINII